MQTLVAFIVAANPKYIWLAIGTNDYGLNAQSAAAFGAKYAQLLDALHSALPNIPIYAQTPLVRSNESANNFGNTTGDYRTAIGTAVSGRGWATLVDGTTILTTNDLADGVHPHLAGHLKYARFVNKFLPSYVP